MSSRRSVKRIDIYDQTKIKYYDSITVAYKEL